MSRETCTGTLAAMSTTVTLISVGIPERDHQRAMSEVAAEVEGWQGLFSRFRAESMLSHVNAAGGEWIQVNEIFLNLLEDARAAVIATEGRFNPAILAALESQGYDRSFIEGSAAARFVPSPPEIVSGEDVWRLVETDRDSMRVRLPRGLRIDFGGIAKGVLADRLADRYARWPGGAISIGGDMRVWGDPPDGDIWSVGIEHPLDGRKDIVAVDLPGKDCQAIATSSRCKRAWQTTNGTAHHLIDPATGASAASSLLAVTVCAPTAMIAEVVTKNVMVAGARGSLTGDLLLGAEWALTIAENLELSRLAREAA